jgi:hypothetical protein
MTSHVITKAAIERRAKWVSEIVRISGTFGEDAARVEAELADEVGTNGLTALLDHVRLAGAIPEVYGHDTSEEKLYSKYTDILLAVAFRFLGLDALVLTERADAADVEVVSDGLSFVADAKAFRLSRTAKNQKDFKVQALDGWKQGKPYALLVAPLYQLPNRSSQIYQQAIVRDVCIFSYAHLAILLGLANASGEEAAQRLLLAVFQSVTKLNPTKDSVQYWRAINDVMLASDGALTELWRTEKQATVEAVTVAKSEALTYLAQERERIMKLSKEEAITQLIGVHKLDNRVRQIERVTDTGLLEMVAR